MSVVDEWTGAMKRIHRKLTIFSRKFSFSPSSCSTISATEFFSLSIFELPLRNGMRMGCTWREVERELRAAFRLGYSEFENTDRRDLRSAWELAVLSLVICVLTQRRLSATLSLSPSSSPPSSAPSLSTKTQCLRLRDGPQCS